MFKIFKIYLCIVFLLHGCIYTLLFHSLIVTLNYLITISIRARLNSLIHELYYGVQI